MRLGLRHLVGHLNTIVLKKIIYLFLGCTGSLSLRGFFSVFREPGLLSNCSVQASHCGGFSCCSVAPVVQGCQGFSIYSFWALEHRLHSCGARAELPHGMWESEMEPRLLHWRVDSFPLILEGRPSGFDSE